MLLKLNRRITEYIQGQLWYCLNAARMGAKVYIMGSFDVTRYLLYLDIYRITFATTVPVILNMLAKYSQPEKFNLKAIEGIVSGSAPLSPDTGRAIKRLYLHEGATIKQGMGLTETTCSLFQFSPDDIDDGRSIGWLNANCRAKIVAVDSELYTGTAPSGVTVGEIMVSGPNIMKGYYRRPNETAQTIITDSAGTRWLRTGDIGYADNRGRFYVVDRMKVSATSTEIISMVAWYDRQSLTHALLGTYQGERIAGLPC
jgi:4-coumarate--CoA ligase